MSLIICIVIMITLQNSDVSLVSLTQSLQCEHISHTQEHFTASDSLGNKLLILITPLIRNKLNQHFNEVFKQTYPPWPKTHEWKCFNFLYMSEFWGGLFNVNNTDNVLVDKNFPKHLIEEKKLANLPRWMYTLSQWIFSHPSFHVYFNL